MLPKKVMLDLLFHRSFTPKKFLNLTINFIEIALKRRFLRSTPPILNLVLSSACNLSCVYCDKHMSDRKRFIDKSVYEKVKNLIFPYLVWLKLGSAGEQFLYPALSQVLKDTSDYRINVAITTNGMAIDYSWIERIFNYNVAQITFSIDGANQKTAEKFRKGIKLKRLFEVIADIHKEKKSRSIQLPYINVNYALNLENIFEASDFVEIAKNSGINCITFTYMFHYRFMNNETSLFHYPDIVRDQFFLIKSKYKSSVMKVILPPYVDQINQKLRSCYFPWNEIEIDTEGNCFHCCNAWKLKPMGNILKDSFRNVIWNNENYAFLRRHVNANPKKCWNCNYCSAKERNSHLLSRHIEA